MSSLGVHVRVPLADAIRELREVIALGQQILAVDIAKGPDGTFLSTNEAVRAKDELYRRTREWHRAARLAQEKLFGACVVDQLTTLGGLFPSLKGLRNLFEHLEIDARRQKHSSPRPPHLICGLHAEIEKRCLKLFGDGHNDSAVFTAFKVVEDTIRNMTGASPEDTGVNLVTKALNPKAPVLRLSSVPAEQEAFHSLFRGAIGVLKNPHSHRFVSLGIDETADLLRFATVLLRFLERAETVDNSN